MRFFVIFFIFSANLISQISLEDLDYFRLISNKNSKSIILNGTAFCNDYFNKNTSSTLNENKYKNIFLCKFSKKRNRFYVYMLSVQKRGDKSLKNFCVETLSRWPEIFDHTEEKFYYQNKKYLDGFYIENFYFDKILSFSKKYEKDQRLINNEIDNFIIKNRKNFSNDNKLNNEIVKKELDKLRKIYKKIISEETSDLDILIKKILYPIVRYKIFVNDTNKFISYSCNWQPGKGSDPYVKKEKFREFDDI